MRDIKFRVWNLETKRMQSGECLEWVNGEFIAGVWDFNEEHIVERQNAIVMQYTGLKDKNGRGLIEVYEGDIIDENGIIKGHIYEMDKRETDIIIPQLGTKAWNAAYEEAVVRGFDYSE